MTETLDKLKELLALCACGVYLTVNKHRDYYQSAEAHLIELDDRGRTPEIEPSVRAEMIARNVIIELQFYPDTPVGFYVIHHHDIDAALALSIETIRSDRAKLA